jgi:hypothetical protein
MSETLEDRANLRQRRGIERASQTTAAAIRRAQAAGSTAQVNRLQARLARQQNTLSQLGTSGQAMVSRGNRAGLDLANKIGFPNAQRQLLGGRLSASKIKGSSKSARVARQAGVVSLPKTAAQNAEARKRGQQIARKTKKQLAANVKRKTTNTIKSFANRAPFGPDMPAGSGAAPKKKRSSATRKTRAPKA